MSAVIVQARVATGATLDAALAEALTLAKRIQVDVEFAWQGRTMRVRPTDTPPQAAARANAALQIKRGAT